MKMIRWSGLVAFVAIVGLIAAFNLLFLDGIIKRIVEAQASLAVGARVEIGDLKIGLFGLNIEIQDLQVANPEQPMRNALDARALAFDLAALPLLRRKFVVQRMKAEDLAWDTPRQTSGTLPPRLRKEYRKASEPGIKAQKGLEDCVLPDSSLLKKLEEGVAEDLLANADLPSAAFLSAYRQKLTDLRVSWDQRLADLPTEKEIEPTLATVRDLKDKRPKAASQFPGYLQTVKEAEHKLLSIRRNLITAQQDFQKELGALRNSLKGVKRLKGEDFKAVWAQLDMSAPSAEDLICVLLGKDLAIKVNRALAWYRRLNRFMPSKTPTGERKKPKVEPVPRLKGADVCFPITRGQPKFLLEVAEFSALPYAKTASGRLSFARLTGEVQGLTSQPALYGKPTVFRFEGIPAGEEAGELAVFAEIDHRKTLTNDHIELIIKDFRVERPQENHAGERSLLLTSAFLDVDGDARIRGENLEGQVRVSIRQPKVEGGSEARMLADLFKDLGPFEVDLSIGGTLSQPVMGLTSSATKTLSASLQKILRTQQEALRRTLKKAIKARVDRELLAAKGDADTCEKRILNELSSRLDLASKIPQTPKQEKKPVEKLKKKILSL